MTEQFTPPEAKNQVTKNKVIAAYRPFIEAGTTNPDDLDLDDPEVQKANQLYDQWQDQVKNSANGPEAKIRADLEITMFYVDAGFTDPDYLEEVANDFLDQDLENASEDPDNPERVETRRQIEYARERIHAMLDD